MGDGRLELRGGVVADVIYQDGRLRVVRTGLRAVALYGEIDISNSSALAGALATFHGEIGDVIVADVGGLTFIDVSGMRTLALPHLDVTDRWLWLCDIPSFFRRLLSLLDWDPAGAMR